jgi:hypothetical protein
MSDEYDKIISRLNGQSFYQYDLDKIGISSDSVMNYERKSGLELCSYPPGRGRSRKFCLMDVYLLTLMSNIVAMTGSASVAAKAVNELFLGEHEPCWDYPESKQKIDEYKERVEADIFEADEIFTDRFSSGHRYIYTHLIRDGFEVSKQFERFDPFAVRSVFRNRRMLYFNVTQLLIDADSRLDDILKKRLSSYAIDD